MHQKALDLAVDHQLFFFNQAVDLAGLVHFFHALKFHDARENGGPVGQGAGQPAFDDVGHAAAFCFHLDGFLRLALGAHKEHGAAISNIIADKFIGALQTLNSLLKVNDMDAVSFSEDITVSCGDPSGWCGDQNEHRFQAGLS